MDRFLYDRDLRHKKVKKYERFEILLLRMLESLVFDKNLSVEIILWKSFCYFTKH